MPPKIWPRERMDYLAEIWHDGWSFSQLAEQINYRFGTYITRSAVAGKLARMSLKTTIPRTVHSKPKLWPRKVVSPAIVPAKPGKPAPRLEVLPPTIWKELVELREGDCRFPYGERVPFPFCGLAAVPETPWCRFHAKLCYNHPPREVLP